MPVKKKPKNPDAVRLAKKRAASLSPARRKAIARKAAKARWEKRDMEAYWADEAPTNMDFEDPI